MNNVIVQNPTVSVKSQINPKTPLAAAQAWARRNPLLEARVLVTRERYSERLDRWQKYVTEYYAANGEVRPTSGVCARPASSICTRNGLCIVCGHIYTENWIRAAFTTAGRWVAACPICVAEHNLALRGTGDPFAPIDEELTRFSQPPFVVELDLAGANERIHARGAIPAAL